MELVKNKHKNKPIQIGIVGFGEVGQIFAKGILEYNKHVYVYDILLEKNKKLIIDNINEIGVKPIDNIEELGQKCDLIFSLVNSSASIDVAKKISCKMKEDTIFIDLTTSTSKMKSESEEIITSKKGIYVDGAIMGTVVIDKNRVPLLIAGNNAEEIKTELESLGFKPQTINQPNGGAASIKMLRSIFMKGLEALILETMITAKQYEVSEEVLNSISKTIDNSSFTDFVNALITTHVIHKNRRHKEVTDGLNLIQDIEGPSFVTEGVISFFLHSTRKEMSESNNIDQILEEYYLK